MKNGWSIIEIIIEIIIVIALILLIAVILVPVIVKARERNKSATIDSTGNKWKTITIEGCEYISCRSSIDHDILTHKGNCTNYIHSYKGQ